MILLWKTLWANYSVEPYHCCCSADIGGAFASDGTGITLTTLTDCEASSNVASIAGGAVAVKGGVTSMSGNTFRNNTAAGRGGAVQYLQECFTIRTIPGEPLLPLTRFLELCNVWAYEQNCSRSNDTALWGILETMQFVASDWHIHCEYVWGCFAAC